MQASKLQWLPIAYISCFWTLKFLVSTKGQTCGDQHRVASFYFV